jgi:hypothetical protein
VTATRPVPHGSGANITVRQDQREHRNRLRAYSRLYRVGQRFRHARAAGAIALAATPLLTWHFPDTADVVAAAAGLWLIVSRALLAWAEGKHIESAVNVQEYYDTQLFVLPWNTSLAGNEPLPDDVADAARKMKDSAGFDQWFRTDLTGVPWPADALLCQRESAVWSRADHRGYGKTLLSLAGILFVATVLLGLGAHLELDEYLIKLGLPITPALLDAVELGRTHLRFASRREQLVRDMTDVWKTHKTSLADLPPSECRRLQDEAYRLRRDAPRVPALFYKFWRNARHETTGEGNAELRRETST